MAESGVPIVCTLGPNELGGRLEEWQRLFAAHLAGLERPAPTVDSLAGIAQRATAVAR